MEATMNRLDTITLNNKRNRLRDVVFACFVTLAAALAVTAMAEDHGPKITTSTQR
jgi:hypothetical protein